MAEKVRMAQSYKALKEGFVSNLSGGDVSEIYIVTAVAPVRMVNLNLGRELTREIYLGGSTRLVSSPEPSRPFHELRSCSIRDRLPTQCWSNTPCNHLVFLKFSPT